MPDHQVVPHRPKVQLAAERQHRPESGHQGPTRATCGLLSHAGRTRVRVHVETGSSGVLGAGAAAEPELVSDS
jgi:hypothetical protein